MNIIKSTLRVILVAVALCITVPQAEASQLDAAVALISGDKDSAYWVYDGGTWHFTEASVRAHANDGNAYERGLIVKKLDAYGHNLIYFELPVTFSDGTTDKYALFCLDVIYDGTTYSGKLYYSKGGGKNTESYVVRRELRY